MCVKWLKEDEKVTLTLGGNHSHASIMSDTTHPALLESHVAHRPGHFIRSAIWNVFVEVESIKYCFPEVLGKLSRMWQYAQLDTRVYLR